MRIVTLTILSFLTIGSSAYAEAARVRPHARHIAEIERARDLVRDRYGDRESARKLHVELEAIRKKFDSESLVEKDLEKLRKAFEDVKVSHPKLHADLKHPESQEFIAAREAVLGRNEADPKPAAKPPETSSASTTRSKGIDVGTGFEGGKKPPKPAPVDAPMPVMELQRRRDELAKRHPALKPMLDASAKLSPEGQLTYLRGMERVLHDTDPGANLVGEKNRAAREKLARDLADALGEKGLYEKILKELETKSPEHVLRALNELYGKPEQREKIRKVKDEFLAERLAELVKEAEARLGALEKSLAKKRRIRLTRCLLQATMLVGSGAAVLLAGKLGLTSEELELPPTEKVGKQNGPKRLVHGEDV